MPTHVTNEWWASFRIYLLPRPLSLLANGLHFWCGVVLVFVAGTSLQSFLFIFLWFFIQEGIVQQAKYMWNDVRDHGRDQHLPANQHRIVACKPITAVTYLLLILRWTMGLLLAWWLSPLCFALLIIVTILQIIYERWGKPYARRFPLLPLLIVGLGAGCKLGGGLLAAGWPVTSASFWLLIIGMLGIGIGYGATLWRVEAEYLHARQLDWHRGQSAFFWENGRFWLRAGTLISLLAGIVLVCLGWKGGGTAVAAMLFIGATLILYRLHAHTDYQQFNWLYARQNWPQYQKIIHDQLPVKSTLACWLVLLQLTLNLNSAQFQSHVQRFATQKMSIGSSD